MQTLPGSTECFLRDRMGAKKGPQRPLLPELFTSSEWDWLAEEFGLSRRKAEVARLICRGCTNEAIAEHLHLSEATVRVYTDGLFKRAGVQCRLGLLVRFVEAIRRTGGNGKDAPREHE